MRCGPSAAADTLAHTNKDVTREKKANRQATGAIWAGRHHVTAETKRTALCACVQTLGQAVARGARADQPVSLYAEIEEEPQGLLLEKLWVSMKNQYEEAYCSGSPILKLISEDAAPTGGRSTRKTRTDDGMWVCTHGARACHGVECDAVLCA